MTNTEPSRRRKQVIAGAVGIAAILGGGAFLVTEAMTDADTVVRDTGALAPLTPAASASAAPSVADPSAAATTPAKSGAATSKSTPTAAPTQKSRAEMIEAMKGAAAKATDKVKRPLPPQGGIAASAGGMTITESGSLKTGGTLKVVSAKKDLTGQGELGIVADEGQPVGDVRCSQNVRFSADAPAVEKPTLMICWRTSATKSVYTVAVVKSGRPSADISAAAVARQWTTLG
jgi:hypothetical protein